MSEYLGNACLRGRAEDEIRCVSFYKKSAFAYILILLLGVKVFGVVYFRGLGGGGRFTLTPALSLRERGFFTPMPCPLDSCLRRNDEWGVRRLLFLVSVIWSRRRAAFSNSRDLAAVFIWDSRSFMSLRMSSLGHIGGVHGVAFTGFGYRLDALGNVVDVLLDALGG